MSEIKQIVNFKKIIPSTKLSKKNLKIKTVTDKNLNFLKKHDYLIVKHVISVDLLKKLKKT